MVVELNKWQRQKGLFYLDLPNPDKPGEVDRFPMKITNEAIVVLGKVFKKYKPKNREDLLDGIESVYSLDYIQDLGEVVFACLKGANPNVDEKDIREFIEGNMLNLIGVLMSQNIFGPVDDDALQKRVKRIKELKKQE